MDHTFSGFPLHKIEGTKSRGDFYLYDYGLSTLEQYGITAESTARTRGGLLCHTEKGLVIVKEFKGTEKNYRNNRNCFCRSRVRAARWTAIFQIRKKTWSAATVTAFHIQCSTGMRAENAIHVPKKTFSKVFAPWQNCISACIYRL